VYFADLVSNAEKHNEANGEGNADGIADNRSSNHGVEGFSDDPGVVAARQQQMRSMLATLLCAQGTPMILAGDEVGRTQGGNNNAYCQDNETSWVEWEGSRQQEASIQFVRCLTALRHELPLLRQSRFLKLRCFAMLLAAEASACLLVMNAGPENVNWTLPAVHGAARGPCGGIRADRPVPGRRG
jgi:pullulanase/glycogen debranching enzyme